MKILILSAILVLFLAVGFEIYNSLRKKKNYFDDFVMFMNLLKVELSFFQNKLEVTIKKLSSNFKKEFTATLNNFCLYLSSNSLEKNVSSFVQNKNLSDEENEYNYQLFSFLGSSDCLSQIEMIENFCIKLNSFQTKHNTNFQKYGSFSLKMAVAIGAVIVILLI